jgi:hypothetical protein
VDENYVIEKHYNEKHISQKKLIEESKFIYIESGCHLKNPSNENLID